MLRRPSHAAYAALAAALGAGLVWALAFGPARWLDAAGLQGFLALRRPSTQPLAYELAHLADALPFALIGLTLVAVALARGRRRVALAIPVVLIGAGVTTQLLKVATADPRTWEFLGTGQIAAASWPSGHATAAMSLALCAVLAAGPRARPVVGALGAAFAIVVSYSLLSLGWHFPSDVLGGFLVAAAWTLGAVAVLRARPEPGSAPALTVAPSLAVGAAALAVVIGLLAWRPEAVLDFAADNTALFALAAAIGVLGMALAAGLAAGLTLSGPRRAPTAARRRGWPPARG